MTTILLVDDCAVVRELFTGAIRDRLGLTVDTLSHPHEVTDDFERQRPRHYSGLRINALRNDRAQLLPELSLHGLNSPRMRELYQFAQRSRPFLASFVRAKGVEFDRLTRTG